MLSSHIVTFTLAVSHSNASLSSSDCSVHKILHLRSLCTQSTYVQWTADRKSKTLLTCHVADLLDFPTEAFYSCPQGIVEVGRRAPGEQSQEHQSVNHTSSPTGDSPASANDVIIRHQLKAERWHFISAWPQPPSLPFTYIMRGLYVSHNWSHMSVFSLLQEAQSRAQARCCRCLCRRRPTRPPTASHTAPEVHRVCWQGDMTSAGHPRHRFSKLSCTLDRTSTKMVHLG